MRTFETLREDDPRQVGPFRIEARLGEGGMGRVYLGRSRSGRAVAVKVVRPELAGDAEFRRRFDREVATARKVNGFFTAGVVDADPQGSPPWLATAYVPGMSLEDAVNEHGPWPEDSVLALGAGLAEALESIHAAGVVHRDLKPSNVLLAGDGPRVIDFGISLAIEGGALTKTGIAMGTPGFMSPEQLRGTRVGPASDVFCLGLVLAFAATGAGPFGQGSWQGLWYRIVHEEPDLGALPPAARALVARCLAKEPEGRPTVSALLNELADGGRDLVSPVQQGRWLPPAVAQAVRTPDAPTRVLPASPETRNSPPFDRPGPGMPGPRGPRGPETPGQPGAPGPPWSSGPPGPPWTSGPRCASEPGGASGPPRAPGPPGPPWTSGPRGASGPRGMAQPYMAGTPGGPRPGGGPGMIAPGPRPAFPAPSPAHLTPAPYAPPAPYAAGPARGAARPYPPPARPIPQRRPRRYPAWLRRTTRVWVVLCGLLIAVVAVSEVRMALSAVPEEVSTSSDGSALTVTLNPDPMPAIYVSGASGDPRCKVENGRGRNVRLTRPAADYQPFVKGGRWRLLYEIRAPKSDTYTVRCSGDQDAFGVGTAPSAGVRRLVGIAVAILAYLALLGVPGLLLAALVTRMSRQAP
ncbi:serine/threonine-protein kinase [Microbispora sp. NPDC088329]|uniref:serine/threonine-protein kinase n=1 Tax=Microbispora sp. NPDC088329 TaxID=3154869 RepID=UPI003419215E